MHIVEMYRRIHTYVKVHLQDAPQVSSYFMEVVPRSDMKIISWVASRAEWMVPESGRTGTGAAE